MPLMFHTSSCVLEFMINSALLFRLLLWWKKKNLSMVVGPTTMSPRWTSIRFNGLNHVARRVKIKSLGTSLCQLMITFLIPYRMSQKMIIPSCTTNWIRFQIKKIFTVLATFDLIYYFVYFQQVQAVLKGFSWSHLVEQGTFNKQT